MPINYLIVGPTLELRSVENTPSDRGDLREGAVFLVTSKNRPLGCAYAQMTPEGLELLVCPEEPFAQGQLAEAYWLFARIAASATAFSCPIAVASRPELDRSLEQDGFRSVPGGWIRPPGPFKATAGAKARGRRAVPFYTAPWNFSPRDWSVLGLLAEHAGVGHAPRKKLAVMRVLDIGCGWGKNATALEELGFAAYGVDLSGAAVARCRELVRHPMRFVEGSAADLPWRNDYFDAVLDIGCLHSLPEALRSAAVSEAARVLKPSGKYYSRSLLPREAPGRITKPIQTGAVGIAPDRLLTLLEPWFHAHPWMRDRSFNYVIGIPRDKAELPPQGGAPR